MAALKDIIEISRDNYNTLNSGGTVTKSDVTYSYNLNTVYVISGGISTNGNNSSSSRADRVGVVANGSSGVYAYLEDNCFYEVEAYNGANYASVNFGVICLTTYATSSNTLTVSGMNTSSNSANTATNVSVQLQLYRYSTNYWHIQVYTSTSSPVSQSNSTAYSLIFRRVRI